MDDIAWLRTQLELILVGEELTFARVQQLAHGYRGYAVEPTHLAALPQDAKKIALVGYPTGRHHDLILAAEARLAVDQGADEVWLYVDEQTETLGTIAAVTQAISPVPVRVSTELNTAHSLEEAIGLLEQDITQVAVYLPA